GNTTIAWSNIPNSSVVVITIIQDGVGSRTITAWPATAKFPGGTAPTLSTGAGKRDQIFFRCDGSNCFMQSISLDVR
ncbi:MAG TPA: hypothetical protein VEF04_20495, partial [Blastocatellia bacterium]|nr:hypothetical protein [Blastocatellia bacterium]